MPGGSLPDNHQLLPRMLFHPGEVVVVVDLFNGLGPQDPEDLIRHEISPRVRVRPVRVTDCQ